jgi:eukaryotic-like serine/threonine-protein kinase
MLRSDISRDHMKTATHVAIAMPSASPDTAGAREFLQDRLALWALWVFILSGGFFLVNLLSWPFLRGESFGLVDTLLRPGNLFHVAAALAFGVDWLIARHVRLSVAGLRVLDAVALIGGCLLFSLMGLFLVYMQDMGGSGAGALYAGLLASANTVLARAIAVPSSSTRTFWLSTVAMLPLLPMAAIASGNEVAVVRIATWAAVTIAVATVGSHVIFGLRTEAARVRRLGQYSLEDKIGEGGMGVVYRASHAMLRRPTAIKLLPPERAGDANLVRFEREVQLTAQLSHPNTVAIYDYGRTPEGVFYYAMEYLDGVNLEELVRRDGPVPAGRVIAILSQVCRALAEAHGRGLVHRDIKPANIILTERGGEPDVAKVVDFGLVKPLATNSAAMTMSASTVLTGTPLYMPPEAMNAPESADPRSDLYAVGAVGYFLLTGHPPFEGATVFEVIGHHLHTTPAPPSTRTTNPVPPDIEAVILQCLSKKPEDRPRDARVLRQALERCTLAPPWTEDNATAWWRAFRSSPPPHVRPPADEYPTGLTITVDVEDRVAMR